MHKRMKDFQPQQTERFFVHWQVTKTAGVASSPLPGGALLVVNGPLTRITGIMNWFHSGALSP